MDIHVPQYFDIFLVYHRLSCVLVPLLWTLCNCYTDSITIIIITIIIIIIIIIITIINVMW